ncbi:glycoside hydrolase family 18 protein [Patescibacteria group bacterium]|nr:glycoside hydrolase family 18 protein [Patescibacteria group bacterium]
MSKIFFSIFLFLLLIFVVLLSINVFYNAPLFSSIDNNSRLRYLKELIIPQKERKIVYGFLPYWNVNDFVLEKELTHLSYFGLNIAANGEISIKDEDGNLDPGYRTLNEEKFTELAEQMQNQGGKVELVLKQFNSEDISAFLNNEKAHLTFFQSLDSLLLAYPVSGINIDIEYSGENSQALRENFVTFMRKLDWYLDTKYKDVQISVDVYASAASNSQSLWDIATIGQYVDYVVVMAYDFHQRSSSQAGPVAPLFSESENNKWNKDINQNLKLFLDQIPREKILLGIPFYGYGWQTDSNNPKANTFEDTGFTVSYKKAKELLAIADGKTSSENTWKGATQIKKSFDSDALSPYITYKQDGEFYTIYYENPESISYKLEYARQLNLAGVAIWALGYEDNDRELWQVIADGI